MNAIIIMLAKILVPLFFIGMAGSALVVLFTVVRDLRQVFKPDDENTGRTDL